MLNMLGQLLRLGGLDMVAVAAEFTAAAAAGGFGSYRSNTLGMHMLNVLGRFPR